MLDGSVPKGKDASWRRNKGKLGSTMKLVDAEKRGVGAFMNSRFLRWVERHPDVIKKFRVRPVSGGGSQFAAAAAAVTSAQSVLSMTKKHTYMQQIAAFENFVLKWMPESSDAATLKKMGDLDKSLKFDYFSAESIGGYLKWQVTPTDQKINGISGAGNKLSSLKAIKSAISYAHGMFGSTKDTAKAQYVIAVKVQAEKVDTGVKKKAVPFDILTDLPKIRDVLLGDVKGPVAKWCWMKRTMIWTMLMLMICVAGRGSTFSDYSPLLETIRLPDASELGHWCPDGFPKYITFTIHNWKRKDKKKPVQTVYIWRNLVNTLYCPMMALVMWMSVSGLKNGPMFRRVSAKGAFDVYFTGSDAGALFRQVFDAAGLPQCAMHSVRHTALGWWTRCYIPDDIQGKAGRWSETSTAQKGYCPRGMVIKKRHLLSGTHDPIFKFWCAKAPILDTCDRSPPPAKRPRTSSSSSSSS